MKKYNFYSFVFTGPQAPEAHIRDLKKLEKYYEKNRDTCHREIYNGFSTFQIETDESELAVVLRLELTDTHYYTDQ